jgi:hypothetical protein
VKPIQFAWKVRAASIAECEEATTPWLYPFNLALVVRPSQSEAFGCRRLDRS